MTRWIVAGVLLAVFLVLLLSDGSGPSVVSPPPAAGDGVAAQGEQAPSGTTPEEEEKAPRVVAYRAACEPVAEPLRALYGDAWVDEAGNAAMGDRTDEEAIALCKELGALPVDARAQRIAELSGMPLPAK